MHCELACTFGLRGKRRQPTGRPNKTLKEVVDSDLKCSHLRASDTLDHKNFGELISGKQSLSKRVTVSDM